MIETVKFTGSKCLVLRRTQQLGVPLAQRHLLGAQTATIKFPVVHPLGKFRHRPVIKDARPRVIAAKTFGAIRRFADFLAVVHHDRPATERVQHGGNWPPHLHSKPIPFLRRGQPHFIVVLGVTQRFVESRASKCERIKIVRPFASIIKPLEHIVGRIVVNRIETSVQQLIQHMTIGQLGWIIVISLGRKKHTAGTAAATRHHPTPKLHRHHVRHVDAKSIDAHLLPIGQYRIHRAPGLGHLIRAGIRPRQMRGETTLREVVTIVQLHRFVPVIDRW